MKKVNKDALEMTREELDEAIKRKEHLRLEFENGYAISIIRGVNTYGWEENLYEIAVIGPDGEVDYSTPITDDVVGYLTGEGVCEYIDKVRSLPKKSKLNLCSKCNEAPASEPHACPYQEDINGNYDSKYCTCCPRCEHECKMDI